MHSQHDNSQLFYLYDHNLLSHFLESSHKIFKYYVLDQFINVNDDLHQAQYNNNDDTMNDFYLLM